MARRDRISNFTREDFEVIHEIARNIVLQPMFLCCEINDIEQELALGLFKMSHRFRSTQASWTTFRQQVLMMYAKKIKYERLKPSSRYMIPSELSLNKKIISDSCSQDDSFTFMDAVTNDHLLADGTEPDETRRLALQFDVRAFVAGLPDDLQEICGALMKSKSQREATTFLKISRPTVTRKIPIIRKYMIAAGLDQYLSSQWGKKTYSKTTKCEVK